MLTRISHIKWAVEDLTYLIDNGCEVTFIGVWENDKMWVKAQVEYLRDGEVYKCDYISDSWINAVMRVKLLVEQHCESKKK